MNTKVMDALLPGQSCFKVADYNEFTKLLRDVSCTKFSVNVDVGFSKWPGENQDRLIQCSNEPLELLVTVQPENNLHTITEDVLVEIPGNDYYKPYSVLFKQPIAYTQDKPATLSVTLSLKPGTKKILPEKIQYKVTMGDISEQREFDVEVIWFAKDFVSNDHLNIILDGGIGSGKSTVSNQIFNLFTGAPQLLTPCLTSKKSDTHTTKKLVRVAVAKQISIIPESERTSVQNLIMSKINLSIYDKWGTPDESKEEMSMGRLTSGCYRPDLMMGKQLLVDNPDKQYAIHAVIFVVPMDLFLDDAKVKPLNARIADALEVGITPIIAFTFMDKFEDGKDRERIRATAQQNLPIDRENMIYMDNYIEGDYNRTISKDMLTFQLLSRAFKIAKEVRNSQTDQTPVQRCVKL
eukprot:gene17167-20447_t